jgi:hypothetical protein
MASGEMCRIVWAWDLPGPGPSSFSARVGSTVKSGTSPRLVDSNSRHRRQWGGPNDTVDLGTQGCISTVAKFCGRHCRQEK